MQRLVELLIGFGRGGHRGLGVGSADERRGQPGSRLGRSPPPCTWSSAPRWACPWGPRCRSCCADLGGGARAEVVPSDHQVWGVGPAYRGEDAGGGPGGRRVPLRPGRRRRPDAGQDRPPAPLPGLGTHPDPDPTAQHVEHEAYMTLLAERGRGRRAPRCWWPGWGRPCRDAVLVTRRPVGHPAVQGLIPTGRLPVRRPGLAEADPTPSGRHTGRREGWAPGPSGPAANLDASAQGTAVTAPTTRTAPPAPTVPTTPTPDRPDAARPVGPPTGGGAPSAEGSPVITATAPSTGCSGPLLTLRRAGIAHGAVERRLDHGGPRHLRGVADRLPQRHLVGPGRTTRRRHGRGHGGGRAGRGPRADGRCGGPRRCRSTWWPRP